MFWVERHPVLLGCPMGRHGLLEGIGLRQKALRWQVQQVAHPTAITTVLEATLHRLPVPGLQPLDEPGADNGLANVGVGAANHELRRNGGHRCSIRVSTCQLSVG